MNGDESEYETVRHKLGAKMNNHTRLSQRIVIIASILFIIAIIASMTISCVHALVTATLSSEAKIISLKFIIPNSSLEYVGVVDENAKTVSIAIPSGIDTDDVVREILLSAGASIDFGSRQSHGLDESYSMKYTIVSIDGTQQIYTINVIREKSDSALFDIILDIIKEPEAEGKDLSVKITLINFGSQDRVNADLTYTIDDTDGIMIEQFSKSIMVNTQMEFIDTVNTRELTKGKYSLSVNLKYPGQKYPAQTEKTFNVGEKKTLMNMLRHFGNVKLIGMGVAILAVLNLAIAILKSRNKSDRFREQ